MAYQFESGNWEHISKVKSNQFICWNCNHKIASENAYWSSYGYDKKVQSLIFICPNCNAPIIIDDERKQVLLPLPGKEIKKLPKNIKNVYDEVRKCMQSNSFTGAVMLMRKIIMNIAVHEGADKNKSFAEYIDYLCDNGIVHKKSKNKADSVRELGNNANHEIENRTQEEAQNCFEFIELLLMANYEFADVEEENGNKS